MRFLQTSDWQLGMTRHYLRGEAQARYTDARLAAVRRLGEIADETGCEMVVVAGDVFDDNQVSSRTVRRALEVLRGIPVPVYLLPGNHDPFDAGSVYRSAVFTGERPDHVHVLEVPGRVQVRPGVELVAAPWVGKHPTSDACADALAGLEAAPPGTVRVLVGHGQVDVLHPEDRHPALIRLQALEEALADGRVHWAALGDRHSRLSVGSSGRVHYSGTQEVTDVREALPGDVLVVDVEPDGAPTVTAHHVGTWEFHQITHDVADDDHEALAQRLDAYRAKERCVVRHGLQGTLSLAAHARLERLLEDRGELFASLHAWDAGTDLAVVVGLDDIEGLEATGFVRTAAEELAATSHGTGAEAAAATDALALLHRLVARGGR